MPLAARPGTAVVLAIVGSVCATLITNALDTSPTVSLIGAALAAAVPALMTLGGAHGVVLGVGVTAAALGVTYVGFTAADAATDRPQTFPLPENVRERVEDGEAVVTTAADGLSIEVTPDTLHCTSDGCEEPVIIKSTGERLLNIDEIEFDGEAAADFGHGDGCEHRSLGEDEECSLSISFTPSGSVGARIARLVIHQNLPGPPTYVDLEGEVDGGPTPPPIGDLLASSEGVQCVHQRGGALVSGEPKDALQIFFSLRLEGASPDQLPGSVQTNARSNLGPSWSARGGVGEGQRVAALPLDPDDYGRTHTVTVSVDPDNEVPESNEDNNQLTVTVALPAQPGSSQSLPC